MVGDRLSTRKLPAHRGVLSYARIPTFGGGITYRLFRRDLKNVLHAEMRPFHPDCDRRLIARDLRESRNRLRDRVDEIDLQFLGVTA